MGNIHTYRGHPNVCGECPNIQGAFLCAYLSCKVGFATSLNKQWNRSLIATKLTMKGAQVVNQEDAQILSQVDSIVKTTKDTTITPFGTIKVKGDIRVPNH